MDKLFVYGTLKPGFSNHYILENIGGTCFEASLFGYQFDNEWERKTGYPGLMKGSLNSKIEGFVFISDNLTNNLMVLDDFETEAYIRKIVPVHLKNNTIVDAFVYLININFDVNNF